ncbi:mannan endo-1,4-beta-mannosidase 6-like [Silene latifolia]|uniref:mannan endo-1,4-beta-mannosidase 6-like n=1 Tax=Silene latifolia TaxID=37657 RepID=UPI003D76AC7A
MIKASPRRVNQFMLVLFHLIHHSASSKFSSSSYHKSLYTCALMQMDFSRLSDEAWTMVGKKGNQFILNDRPFYFNGFNTYWLMVFASDLSARSKVTQLFQQASSVGLTVCRTWAFNDGQWCALQKSPSLYDEHVFKGLDFVVSEAKKHKIRLILSLVNNWNDYGGKAQYVKWGKQAGLNLSSDDDFFSDSTLKTYYKNHVKTVLNRVNTYTKVAYKDDPTILAWELMNEPQCTSDSSGDKLQAWIEEMAVYVKSFDTNHLLVVGLEGFYGPSTPERTQFNPNTYATQVGTDFIRNHQVLGVDFASVHIYADSWMSEANPDAHLEFYKSWLQSHIEDADQKLRMPVVFSEFGVSRKNPECNSCYRDATFKLVYETLEESAKRGGSAAGSLMWQLFPEGVDHMCDGYEVVLSKSASFSDIIALHSTRMMLPSQDF